MQNNFETLSFEMVGEIGLLKVNRPQKLNALNRLVLTELKKFLHSQPDLKGLIFTGSGEKAFIAGADIAEMKDLNSTEAKDFCQLGQEVSLLLEGLPFPTVACVHGFALGGGFEMALACDFIFSSKKAVFGLPELKLGLIPGFGGTQRLQEIVGYRAAKEMIFSGRNISAEEAFELGISLKLFDSQEELVQAAVNWMEDLKSKSPLALRVAKKLIKIGDQLSLEKRLEMEKGSFGELFSSFDMKEGTSAFLEKRSPHFKGN